MKMRKLLALSVAALTLAFAVPQVLSAADDAATIKKNMADRKPKIEELKKAGTIGENKSGYLEAMKDAKLEDADKKIVEDENKGMFLAALLKRIAPSCGHSERTLLGFKLEDNEFGVSHISLPALKPMFGGM